VNRRFAGAVVAASVVALALSACSSSKKSSSSSANDSVLSTDGKGKTVTVWLQSDAQKGWPAVVDQANQRFEQATGAKVNVQWQQWSNYTTKLDSTFAGSSGIPDVVELGNTQTASYIAAGAFADLTKAKGQFENSASWLKGLTDSGTSPSGKLEAVPY
jgi:N,N'-diacetylchitobiose transport system substrate-binding protein